MPTASRRSGWPLDRDPYLLETSVPGVFAAGDVRHGSVKRVAAAVGEGSVAVTLSTATWPRPESRVRPGRDRKEHPGGSAGQGARDH